MERKTPAPPDDEHLEIHKESRDAHEGDKELDDYDKEVADSFPASDPPAWGVVRARLELARKNPPPEHRDFVAPS